MNNAKSTSPVRTEAALCDLYEMPTMPTLRLASLALVLYWLTACTASKPDCQKDPPFYLKGTRADCATVEQEAH